MDKIKINWFTKLLFKFSPRMAMQYFARSAGIENPTFDRAHQLFSGVERVDIFPYESGHRGFSVILDQNTALYFNQDGDHFVYDGYEMGEYEKGDVTIFDDRKR